MKSKAVIGLDYADDSMTTNLVDTEKSLRVFPSLKPTKRFEVNCIQFNYRIYACICWIFCTQCQHLSRNFIYSTWKFESLGCTYSSPFVCTMCRTLILLQQIFLLRKCSAFAQVYNEFANMQMQLTRHMNWRHTIIDFCAVCARSPLQKQSSLLKKCLMSAQLPGESLCNVNHLL